MITTTRRETDVNVAVDNIGSVRRISPQEHTVSISTTPEVEVHQPYAQVASVAIDTTTTQPVSTGEIMPTIRSEQAEQVEQKKEVRKLSAKAKMLVYIYMVAAAILAMVVLFTGLAITGASKDVATLQTSLSMQSAVLASQTETITYLGEDEVIAQKAASLGMSETASMTAIELIELGGATEYEAKTNAFDKFCDFLGGIIGG